MRKIMSAKCCLVVLLSASGFIGTSLAQTNTTQTPEPVQKPAALVPVAPKSWTDYVTVKGDMRLRLETINDDSKKNSSGENYTRDRLRIRARLGAEAKLEDLKTGIRISTGGADPISGNVTLGDGDQKKEIRLDLAYLDYSFLGDSPSELRAIGGKMNNPLITYGADDLVWDQDLTPEGIAAKARFGNDWLNAEGLYIQDRDSKPNATGWIGQGALKFTFVPEIALTLGGSYSAYQNIQGYDVIDWENKNNSYGNSTIKGSVSGGTDGKGSRFYGKYQITKYLQFAAIFFLDKKNISSQETSYNRLQVDLQGTF